MKITIEHNGQRIVVEDESVVDICDAIDLVERGFWEIGFDKERVEGAILVKAKQITSEWE